MIGKEHKYHYIYKITNLKNNKYYIGMHSTFDLEDGYMGGGTRIRNSIRFHGKDVHLKEILEYLPDRISLAAKEKEIVNEELLKDPLCMNLVIGGECGFRGGFISENHKKKFIKEGNKAAVKSIKEKFRDEDYRKNWAKKRKDTWDILPDDARKSILFGLKSFKNKKHSNETKEKIGNTNSIKQKGEKNSQFGTCWIAHSELGNKKIKKDDIDQYLINGWKQGRKILKQ